MLELVSVTKTCGFAERKTTESVVQATKSSGIDRRIEGAGTSGNFNQFSKTDSIETE